MSDNKVPDRSPTAPPAGGVRKLLHWARRHPFRTAFLLVLLFVVYEAASLPWFSVARLALANPDRTALMRQRLEEAADRNKPFRIQHHWVRLERIPRPLVEAVIVAEDGTFFTHRGFDWYEVGESFERNFKELRFARGASTITQQLAKNLYLSTSKDPVRKLKEAAITLMLEHTLSKSRILELYLNTIEWGRGIFGAEAAAQVWFHKPCSDLNPEECARLAAVIPSPLRHRPDTDSRYVLRRSAMVQHRLAARARGIIVPTTEEDQPSPDPTTNSNVDVATDSLAGGLD